jgi:Glycosyl hydrolases family 35
VTDSILFTSLIEVGQPFGYTSYDYGSPISEERLIDKEKYSEAKLQANFLVASPQYLDVEPEESFTTGNYTTSSDLAVTRLDGPDSSAFFVIRLVSSCPIEKC